MIALVVLALLALGTVVLMLFIGLVAVAGGEERNDQEKERIKAGRQAAEHVRSGGSAVDRFLKS